MKESGTNLNAPVRLCCGQRHFGPICPDGKVMCCLCFERKEPSELHIREDGYKEDVCLNCHEEEKTRIKLKTT